MNNTVSPEVLKFLAQANGTIEALVLAFGALAATHPQKETVMALINQMLEKHAAESDQDTESAKNLKTGMRRALLALTDAVRVAQLAEEGRTSARH